MMDMKSIGTVNAPFFTEPPPNRSNGVKNGYHQDRNSIGQGYGWHGALATE